MKSIERRFSSVINANPKLSDYMAFAHAVRGGNFSRSAISRHFNRLVPVEEYSVSDKKALIRQLVELSGVENSPEDDQK